MIGLARGTVKLADYSVRWPEIAGETIRQLQEIFGGKAVDIQHIGSTAIIGIKAKPIIDINAAECAHSQRAYTDGKQAYMKRILNEVRTWADSR